MRARISISRATGQIRPQKLAALPSVRRDAARSRVGCPQQQPRAAPAAGWTTTSAHSWPAPACLLRRMKRPVCFEHRVDQQVPGGIMQPPSRGTAAHQAPAGTAHWGQAASCSHASGPRARLPPLLPTSSSATTSSPQPSCSYLYSLPRDTRQHSSSSSSSGASGSLGQFLRRGSRRLAWTLGHDCA